MKFSSSLDNSLVKMRRESRVKTILEAGFLKYQGNARLSFLTLTSASDSVRNISRSFQALMKRIKRQFPFDYQYVRIKTDEGNGVLHVLIKAPYLPQATLSRWWQEIHGAKIVDIRKVKLTKRLKNYLTPYLQGQSSRLSSSREWIYRGWRKEYRKIATRIYWHYYPRRLVISPLCQMAYIKSLYFYFKIDMIINSLLPINPNLCVEYQIQIANNNFGSQVEVRIRLWRDARPLVNQYIF